MTDEVAHVGVHAADSPADVSIGLGGDGLVLDASEQRGLEERLLELLPEDGRSRLNADLIKDLEVDKEHYWKIRDRLVEDGLAVRGRGRGGSTARVLIASEAGALPKLKEGDEGAFVASTERELYEPLREVLKGDWQSDNGFDYLAVEDVSRGGSRPTGGKWTRPDLVAVEVQVYGFLPSKVLSVHTFEVKKASAVDVTAVYEALSHRRASTHSFVLLEVPNPDEPPQELDSVIMEARQHGIGVITFATASNYTTWDEKVVAERVEPEPGALNEFLKTQLPEASQRALEKQIR